ncbi:MAG: radical SAM protein, partial [Elusimicrobia bacterium]|nr:radical SAM protein [Elusimicrobiota bacterium]
LADGDAIALPQSSLKYILEKAINKFPNLTKIAIYGSIKSLQNKTVNDLKELKDRKLSTVYLGFETGDKQIYDFIEKFGSPEGNVETCLKVKEAGLKTNVTVILGLGGKKHSQNHAINTAKILNQAQPHQIAALTLMIAPRTPLYSMLKRGEFEQLEDFDFLKELHLLIKNLEDFKCLFFSNHASNYYPINARFPRDKETILNELDEVIQNGSKKVLKPEFLRGL